MASRRRCQRSILRLCERIPVREVIYALCNKADGQLRSVSATMVLEDDETLVEELPNWLLTKLEEIGNLAGKAASEGAWRSEELSATARQLEALEEAEADVPPAHLLGGTRKAWLRYRGQLSSWKEGSFNFPDRSFRPTRPDPDLIKHV